MRRAILFLLAGWLGAAEGPPAPVQFRPHVIEPKIPRGYAVLVTDLNKDGRPDVIGLASQGTELAWYENPSWQRHVLVDGMTGLVNLAAHDLDGDGIPELAVESEFSMVAAKSKGLVWLLRHQGDPRQAWKARQIDALTTSHHVGWADVDGDGSKEMINAPLIGPQALAPRYEDRVPLVYYHAPRAPEGDWPRRLIDDQLTGVLHRLRVVRWEPGKREQILTAGFDGIVLHRSRGKGERLRWENRLLARGHQAPPPRAGSSDVGMGRSGKRRFLAAVEPWHGNEVVVYTGNGGAWRRRVIFSELREGHEVALADFNGDGRDDIVAGDRGKGASVHVFFAQHDRGEQWRHQVLDPGAMAASGCTTADLNLDRRPDVICIGSSTGNLKWYENLGR